MSSFKKIAIFILFFIPVIIIQKKSLSKLQMILENNEDEISGKTIKMKYTSHHHHQQQHYQQATQRSDKTYFEGRGWEAHLLIDWNNAIPYNRLRRALPATIYITDEIKRDGIEDEKTQLKTLQKFYGYPITDKRFANDYTIYLLNDTAPIYDFRHTTKGPRRVNVGILDTKNYFRQKNIYVHASDNTQETRDHLKLLGLKYPKKFPFKTMEEVFQTLNEYRTDDFSYVVLRNFDGLPENVAVDEHFDLDILVSDYYSAKRILDAWSSTDNRYEDGIFSKGRIQNRFTVGDSSVQTDIRFVGDGYYDAAFEQEILASRVKVNGVVFVPSKTNHKFSLLYHALVQKPTMSFTYRKQMVQFFGTADIELLTAELLTWLLVKGYDCTRPKDPSVYFKSLF